MYDLIYDVSNYSAFRSNVGKISVYDKIVINYLRRKKWLESS